MPFPLPDGGPPYSEDLRWFLVAVPDDAAFVRAALGAYTEFTKYWVWGKEGKEPGRNEAAQVWENAVAATLEALEMGFPDILLGYIDQVEQLLQELIDKPCCADAPPNVVTQPTPSMEPTDIQDGVGSPPPTYGGDPVTDWSDWEQRKCGMAEVLKVLPANLLEELLGVLEQENQPGWVEYIGDLLGKIPGVGEIGKIIWDTFAQLLSWGINQFTGADEAIALIRAGEDDIKCAMYSADGEEAAAEAMKQATIDALGEYGHATIRIGLNYFPWELWAHVLYTGQFEDVDGNLVNVPYVPATDCCLDTTPVLWTFDTDNQDWERHGAATNGNLLWDGATPTYEGPAQWNASGNPGGSLYHGGVCRIEVSPPVMIAGGSIDILFDYLGNSISGCADGYNVILYQEDGIYISHQGFNGSASWSTSRRTFSVPATGSYRIGFRSYGMYLDNVTWEATPA